MTRIDIQVHLEDARCVAELKRVTRQTLRRAARTWAPLPIPIDRVVLGVGFPATGKIDLYDNFPRGEVPAGDAARPFVVISLGLRDGDRELEPAEVAGALAAQVQAVIDDRHRRQSRGAQSEAESAATIGTRERVAGPTVVRQLRPSVAPATAILAAPPAAMSGGVEADPPRIQELVATAQKSQPLEVAGSLS